MQPASLLVAAAALVLPTRWEALVPQASSHLPVGLARSLTFDWTVVGSMSYTAMSADIVFRFGLQNTVDLWTRTFSPPTGSGTADLDQHGTETIAIPKGAPAGEFSIDVQYVGAVGVTEAQCVIAYVDNLQVK